MREMTTYASSLTGATGKILVPETITVGPKQLLKLVEEKPLKHDKDGKSSSKGKKEEPQDVSDA